MGIFVFICIYKQIQKYPYLLKYLSQRSEICCASLPHKVRTLSQFSSIFGLFFTFFRSMKLLFNDPIIDPLWGGGPRITPCVWTKGLNEYAYFRLFGSALPSHLFAKSSHYPHSPRTGSLQICSLSAGLNTWGNIIFRNFLNVTFFLPISIHYCMYTRKVSLSVATLIHK